MEIAIYVTMNIVIISSSDSGGAGIAALRLHKALLALGENSHLLCFNKSSNAEHVYQIVKPLYCRVLEHLPIPYRNNKYRKIAPLIDKDYECISFPESIDYLSDHPLVKDADVINLHWVGNHLAYKNFFKKVNKPIVWTLHDMNPFLGCAHFSRDVNAYPQWHDIENNIRKKKEKWIHNAKLIEVVDLCTWMNNYSTASPTLGRYPHYIIHNSIDTSIFKEYPKEAARTLLDIPSDKPVLMFVSQNINNKRKGFDLLLNALANITGCYLMVIGTCNGTLQLAGHLRYFGCVTDEKLMAILYAAADAFLLPSREDNLPNTMVESLCCGTPVVTMPNGGMTDIIKNGYNGYICEDISSESFAKAINTFLESGVSMKRNEIANEAQEIFSPSVQAMKYVTVYKHAIANYDKDI